MALLLFIILYSSSAVFASSPLAGFTYMSPTGKNTIWEKLPVKICVSTKVPENIQKQFSEAVKVWNDAFQKEIFSTCEIVDGVYKEGDATTHGVYWITSGFEKITDKTSFARTEVDFENSGKIRDSDILLNGQYYDWASVTVDAQTILIHELGHVLA